MTIVYSELIKEDNMRLKKTVKVLGVCDIVVVIGTLLTTYFVEIFVCEGQSFYFGHNMDEKGPLLRNLINDGLQTVQNAVPGFSYLIYSLKLFSALGYFILEVWLSCVLIRASNEERFTFCTKWLHWRCSLFIISIMLTFCNVFLLQVTCSDLIWIPLHILRAFSIVVVYRFRRSLGVEGEFSDFKL